jgi:hypothetical protein
MDCQEFQLGLVFEMAPPGDCSIEEVVEVLSTIRKLISRIGTFPIAGHSLACITLLSRVEVFRINSSMNAIA